MGEKRGEEKEQEVVARVLSRFRPKEVRRREPNQSRRRTVIRTIHQDATTTRNLLYEKLRLINLHPNEASSSSSSQKHHQTPPPRFWPSRTTDLPQQQSKVKSFLETSQEYAERKQSRDDAKPEITIKSSPFPTSSSSSTERNCYSKLLPISEMFAGGFGLIHQKLAQAVHIRSVIPVCSAPPHKPNPNPKNPSAPSASNESTTSFNPCSDPRSVGIGGKRSP